MLDFYYHLSNTASQQSQCHRKNDGIASDGTLLTNTSTKTAAGGDSFSAENFTKDNNFLQESRQGICSVAAAKEEVINTSFESRHFLSLLLQPRSLVLVQEDMYKVHLHGIKEVMEDVVTDKVANLDFVLDVKLGDIMPRSTRVSLTIRFIPKVLKSKLIFGKRSN